MKVFFAALVAVLVVPMAAVPAAASAATSAEAYAPYYISEETAANQLQRHYDYAYCMGIQRFGHRGSFPYEKFRVFDCDMKLNGTYCTDVRYKSVSVSARYWRFIKIRNGDCF